jgi:hypothetical protein
MDRTCLTRRYSSLLTVLLCTWVPSFSSVWSHLTTCHSVPTLCVLRPEPLAFSRRWSLPTPVIELMIDARSQWWIHWVLQPIFNSSHCLSIPYDIFQWLRRRYMYVIWLKVMLKLCGSHECCTLRWASFFFFLLVGSNHDPPVIRRISLFELIAEAMKLVMLFINMVMKLLMDFISSPEVGAKVVHLISIPLKY